MLKRIAFLALWLNIIVGGNVFSAEPNKYQIKSGIIEYQISGNQVGAETFYFENYGQKEARHINSTMTIFGIKQSIEQVVYVDGDWSYTYDPKKNSAERVNNKELARQMMEGTKSQSLREFGEEVMKDMGGNKTGSKKILGKSCDIWDISKIGATVCVYKNSVPLELTFNIGGFEVNSVATSISENVSVPSEKITLPKNAKIKDAPIMKEMPGDDDMREAAKQMPSFADMMKQMQAGGEDDLDEDQDDREYNLKKRELDLKAKELELKEKQLNQSAQPAQPVQPAQQKTDALDEINNTVNTTNKIKSTFGGLKSLLRR